MKHYVEFDIATSRIVRRGRCQSQHMPRPRRLNAIAFVRAGYEYNAVVCDKINDKKIAINPTLIRKSFDTQKPEPIKIPEGKRPVNVTNEQWQKVQDRLDENQDRLDALDKLLEKLTNKDP